MDAQALSCRPVAPRPFARCPSRAVPIAVPQVAASLGSQLPRRRPVYHRSHKAVVAPAGRLPLAVWAQEEQQTRVGSWGYPEDINKDFSWGGTSPLGKGSYGTVFPGIKRGVGEECAVKVLPKLTAAQKKKASKSQDPRSMLSKFEGKSKERVDREVGALRNCQSPNVIGFKGVYEDADSVYLVLERMSGGDLSDVVMGLRQQRMLVKDTQGLLPEPVVARIVFECLKLLATTHARGYIHMDIKPANFMLSAPIKDFVGALSSEDLPDGWLKAIDFGCSDRVSQEGEKKARGTPLYMAPETWNRKYVTSSDMWSLGMMMYQLVADRFPFWDTLQACNSVSQEDVKRKVLDKEQPVPFNYGPWLSFSDSGKALLERMLDREAYSRITAAKALKHQWFRDQPWWKPSMEMPSVIQNNIVPLSDMAVTTGGGAYV